MDGALAATTIMANMAGGIMAMVWWRYRTPRPGDAWWLVILVVLSLHANAVLVFGAVPAWTILLLGPVLVIGAHELARYQEGGDYGCPVDDRTAPLGSDEV